MERQERTITLLGAGNVAWSLAPALDAAPGWRVTSVWARREAEAAGVAALTRSAQTATGHDVPPADVYVLAVADSAVAAVARMLPGDAVVVHTSGSVPLEALPQARRGVLYPLMTFTRGRRVAFEGLPMLVEGCTEAMEMARAMGADVHEADSEARARVHVAAVFACNFANRMWTLAADTLAPSGLALGALAPLMRETLDKALDPAAGPRRGQTGPAARGDQAVISRHEQALADRPDALAVYRAVTRSILTENNLTR